MSNRVPSIDAPSSLSRARARSSRRILDAARSLVEAEGLEELSMRRLADEADVSVRTIYNVFGDKHGVVAALVEGCFEAMDAATDASVAVDPIERVWETIEVSIDANCRHVPRAIVAAIVSDPVLNAEVAPRWGGRQLILESIASAVRHGVLRGDVAPDRLFDQAGPIHAHRLRQWADGDIDERELRASVLYAYDVTLLADARPRARTRLLAHMDELSPSIPPVIVDARQPTPQSADR